MSENGTQAGDSQRIKVEGLIFSAPRPYSAGHVLLENEANSLNQTLAENLRNNYAKAVKAWKEEQTKAGVGIVEGSDAPEDLQADFTTYAADYEFGSRRTSGAGDASLPKDPTQREAHIMAREMIRAYAKQKGVKLDAEQVNQMVPGLLAKKPEMLEEARRRVENKNMISIEELELPEPAAATTEQAAGEEQAAEGTEQPSKRSRKK